MASISLVVLGFIAVIIGLLYFYKKTKSVSGSVIVLAAGLLCLYIATLLSDVVLDKFGFETGFPDIEGGYYFYQSLIYLVLGLFIIGTHHYLIKEEKNKEISFAFLWTGTVLMIIGGLDLLLDTFIRIDLPEIRLIVAIAALGILLFLVNRYRNTFFGKEEGKIPK